MDTTDFLLNIQENGMEQMKSFIKECSANPNRFDQPIKRNKLNNFTMEMRKCKKSVFKHIDQSKIERNVLGQILCMAITKKVDLLTLFSHPLTAVPHSLAHFDGTIISTTQKAELTAILLSKSDRQHTSEKMKPDVDIIDGFNVMKYFQEAPTKYGQLSTFLLRSICNTGAQEIHIIFDKYEKGTPKDIEMKKQTELYDNMSVNFVITGPNQERSSSLSKCLSSNSFREQFVKFLLEQWSKDEVSECIVKEKRVFLSFGRSCYVFSKTVANGKLVTSLENNHFEIESKAILHMNAIRFRNICIQTPNIDTILVYSLYHMHFWPLDREVWIKSGDIKKHTYQLVNVRQIFKQLSPSFVNGLPGWYAFTGCTYEPSFFGKGRKTCMKLFENNTAFQSVFGKMGSETLNEDDISVLEMFTCALYNKKNASVNHARVSIFESAYGNCANFNKKGNRNINYELSYLKNLAITKRIIYCLTFT